MEPAASVDPASRRTSGKAIAALVFGILGLCFCPLSLVAVGLGILALIEIGKNPQLEGKVLAIIGLALVPVAIVTVAARSASTATRSPLPASGSWTTTRRSTSGRSPTTTA